MLTHIPPIKTRTLLASLAVVAGLTAVGVSKYRAPGGSAAPAAGAAPAAASPANAGKPKTETPLSVQVHIVKPETLSLSVPATGRLVARESVDLVSELSRRLRRVRVQEGSQVKKGDVLFELDAADLRAELAQLKVQIDLARVNSERQAALLNEGLSSLQEEQTTRAQFAALQAQQHVLDVALSKATVRAPFAGTVGLRRVSEGAWVSPNTVLVSLHDTSQLKLDFSVPERYASLVVLGAPVRFKAEGRPETFEGRISAFEPTVDQNSRSILVRAVVNNEKSLLPGTFATVDLPLKSAEVLLVPSIAVIPGSTGRSLFVEREGVAHSVSVELGERSGERVQVISGITVGDRVIVSNLLRVRPGARVTVAASAEAKP